MVTARAAVNYTYKLTCSARAAAAAAAESKNIPPAQPGSISLYITDSRYLFYCQLLYWKVLRYSGDRHCS